MFNFLRTKVTRLTATLALTCSLPMLFSNCWPCCGAFGNEASGNQIQTIYQYNEVQAVFDSCHERDLVTFDVDGTLITATDVLAREADELPLWFKIRLIFNHLSVALKTETREKTIDSFLGAFLSSQVHRFVFDPDIVRLIKQLQQQKCPIVGLTKIISGSAGAIKSVPESRASMLKAFGIDFSSTFANTSFAQFPKKHNNLPCLYNGILFANFTNKGAVLGAFLDYSNVKPERIVCFDDQYDALVSIADECRKQGIPFAGYQILGAKKLTGGWDADRAFLQFETALEHGIWLNDAEADAIIAGKTTLADLNKSPSCA
jgi:hypothetical protein